MSPRSRARQCLAAAAALVLVVSIVLVGWHRATVLHGRCAEHGEEIHLERVGAGHVCADRAVAEVTDPGWLERDGDSHCEILATARSPHAATSAPSTHPVIAQAIDDAPALPALAPPLAQLFRLAPKTSPPGA